MLMDIYNIRVTNETFLDKFSSQYPREGASLAPIFFHPRSQSPRPNNREGRVEEGSLVDWNADKKIREAD